MKKEDVRGLGVDFHGDPVKDPTISGISIVEQAIRRQDDLRAADEKYLLSKIECVKEISMLQAGHVKEVALLRSVYEEKIALSEKGRIDAIRAVDANAVSLANEKQSTAAVILANEVTKSADTLRTLVATTAQAAQEQQRQMQEQFNKRLSDLEKAINESRGKGGGMNDLWKFIVSIVATGAIVWGFMRG